MDPARKRTIRLVVALTAAVLLAGGLVYTSFSASSPAKTPGQLAASAPPGRSYKLTGKVAAGAGPPQGGGLPLPGRRPPPAAAVAGPFPRAGAGPLPRGPGV